MDRAAWRAGLCVCALAVLVRGLYLWDSADYPAFLAPIVDADRYDALARLLAAGGDPGLELHWQAPFYPAFLSLIYRLGPGSVAGSIVAAKIAQAALGAATSLVVWRLGTRMFGERAGWLAGALHAVYGPALFFETELLGTGWEMFWAAALPWLWLRQRERPGGAWSAAAGAALGLALLTRATFLPFCIGCLAAWGFGCWRRAPRAVSSLAAGLLGLALTLAPAVWHRAAHGGRVALLPLSAGVNLHIGNNAERCQTLAARPGKQWQAIVDQADPVAGGDAVARDAYFRERFARYALQAPQSWGRGLFAKLGQLVAGRELPRNDDLYWMRRWSPGLRALVHELGLPFALLLPLALLGLWQRRRELPLPFGGMLLTQAGALVLVFVSARHRMLLVPLLAVLAAAGVLGLLERSASVRRRLAALAALLSMLGFSLAVRDPCGQTRLPEAELFFAVAHRQLGLKELALADRALDRALELDPDFPEALLASFFVRLKQDRVEAAWPRIERYARLRPEEPLAQQLLEATRVLLPASAPAGPGSVAGRP